MYYHYLDVSDPSYTITVILEDVNDKHHITLTHNGVVIKDITLSDNHTKLSPSIDVYITTTIPYNITSSLIIICFHTYPIRINDMIIPKPGIYQNIWCHYMIHHYLIDWNHIPRSITYPFPEVLHVGDIIEFTTSPPPCYRIVDTDITNSSQMVSLDHIGVYQFYYITSDRSLIVWVDTKQKIKRLRWPMDIGNEYIAPLGTYIVFTEDHNVISIDNPYQTISVLFIDTIRTWQLRCTCCDHQVTIKSYSKSLRSFINRIQQELGVIIDYPIEDLSFTIISSINQLPDIDNNGILVNIIGNSLINKINDHLIEIWWLLDKEWVNKCICRHWIGGSNVDIDGMYQAMSNRLLDNDKIRRLFLEYCY